MRDSFHGQLLPQSSLVRLAETVLGVHHDVMAPLPKPASCHFLSQGLLHHQSVSATASQKFQPTQNNVKAAIITMLKDSKENMLQKNEQAISTDE